MGNQSRHTAVVISGHSVLIDTTDLAFLNAYNWRVDKGPSGHLYVHRTRDSLGLHNLLIGDLSGLEVDHRDGNGLNNTRGNLRHATHQENMRNMRKMRGSVSKFKGVTFVRNSRKNHWKAGICTTPDGRRKWNHLGVFPTEELAARAYDAAARKLFGEFACLNFPNPGEPCALPEPQRRAA